MWRSLVVISLIAVETAAWVTPQHGIAARSLKLDASKARAEDAAGPSRRDFLGSSLLVTGALMVRPDESEAIGPVKIDLLNPKYSAVVCPKVGACVC